MKKLFVSFVCVFVCIPVSVDSARLYLDPTDDLIQDGDSSVISIRLDVDRESGDCINAADFTITYPPYIQAVDTTTRNSIFPLWIERPIIDSGKNQVRFRGGIPNGYCGRVQGDPNVTNIIAEIIFRTNPHNSNLLDPEDIHIAKIDFSNNTYLYLNDGLGTELVPETSSANIQVLSGVGAEVRDEWLESIREDTIPPEPFSIYLERGDNVYGGDYYIVFNTTDKQSGIATYEVMEEPLEEQHLFRFGEVGAPWVTAESPYRLQDQTLNSTIRVRAIDKAGNEYVATLVPDPSLRTRVITQGEWIVILMSVSLVFVLAVVTFVLWRRRNKIQNNLDASVNKDT